MKTILALAAATLALLLAACSGGSTIPSGPALVYVSGTIVSVSGEQLVVHDILNNNVTITLEEAEDPSAQFCRQVTTPNYCAVLSEAAPQAEEEVCVQAQLTEHGELIARFVLLESTCQQVPSTPPTS